MAIEEVDGILGVEGQPSVAGAAFPANGAELSDRKALFEASLARERAAAATANPAPRYAFNDTAKQQEVKTDAVEPQGKPGEPPRNAEPGWQGFLKGIGVRGGLIGLGAEAARWAADDAARRSEATGYYGPDLALRVYPQGQPGPNGAKAAFLRRGADGTESVLPVRVEPREDVYRYHMQPLRDAVRFDPAELGRAYDLSKLSAYDRERLGLPPSAAGDRTAAGQDRQGFSIETRDQEERDLVDSMLAQGKSADEIQNALNELRARRSNNSNLPDTFRLGRLVAPGFEAPKVFLNKQGMLTNGTYTLDQQGMAPHLTGNLASGKSQFLHRLNAPEVTLDAAAYADKEGLWIGNKAKVAFDGPIGVHAGTGKLTNVLNVYRSGTGHVHSAPGTPE